MKYGTGTDSGFDNLERKVRDRHRHREVRDRHRSPASTTSNGKYGTGTDIGHRLQTAPAAPRRRIRRYLSDVALGPHLVEDGVLVLTQPADRRVILEHAASAAAAAMADAGVAAEDLLAALEARENQSPTGTPEGVAFPHAILPGLPRSVVVAIRTASPVEFGTNRPCDLVFAMFGDANQPWHHVRLLARLARITGPTDARTRLRSATTGDDLRAAILAEDAANA